MYTGPPGETKHRLSVRLACWYGTFVGTARLLERFGCRNGFIVRKELVTKSIKAPTDHHYNPALPQHPQEGDVSFPYLRGPLDVPAETDSPEGAFLPRQHHVTASYFRSGWHCFRNIPRMDKKVVLLDPRKDVPITPPPMLLGITLSAKVSSTGIAVVECEKPLMELLSEH